MQKVLAFDPKDGRQLWSCDTGINWYMVPSIVAHDGIIYCIGGRSGGALAIRAGGRGDVTASHRLWTGRRGSNVTSPLYHDGHLYWMHENTGVAYCADAATGNLLYEQRIDRFGQVYAPPVLADGRIYYLARNGMTAVIKAAPTFQRLALNDLRDGSTFNAGPAISGKRIYLRSERFLYAIQDNAGAPPRP
jgi:outer membrane protein assembly factor BamB